MSKVLQIIVEGKTEKGFVEKILYPYFFNNFRISNIRTITLETSEGHKGGNTSYSIFRKHVIRLLSGKETMMVTSLIDFYRLPNDFPNYEKSKTIKDPVKRVEEIEKACYEDINDERFLPYIQLHEIEALLFSSIEEFEILKPDKDQIQSLEEIVKKFPNPELIINQGGNTAPSKRLEKIFDGYQKSLHGIWLADEIGIEKMRSKCPRFNKWVNEIIQRIKE
jgi:hypothetical protein